MVVAWVKNTRVVVVVWKVMVEMDQDTWMMTLEVVDCCSWLLSIQSFVVVVVVVELLPYRMLHYMLDPLRSVSTCCLPFPCVSCDVSLSSRIQYQAQQ